MTTEENHTGSPVAGGLVIVTLGGVGFAAVFAASPTAGVLAVWLLGTAAIWWSTRRRKSVRHAPNPTPPPVEATPPSDVFADETGEVEKVQKGPGALRIVYPVRTETARPPANSPQSWDN